MSRLSTCLIFLSLAMDPRLYCYRHHPLNWNLLSRHNAIHYLSAFRSKEHSVWLCNTLSSWGLVDDSLQICDNLQASLTNPLASIPSHSSWRYHQGLSLSLVVAKLSENPLRVISHHTLAWLKLSTSSFEIDYLIDGPKNLWDNMPQGLQA